MRHGAAFSLLALLASGCATSADTLAREGLGEEDIRRLIGERWENDAENEDLAGTRLVAIRDIDCRRAWTTHPRLPYYLCYFTADLEKNGRMRSMRRNKAFGRNNQGQWTIIGIVSGG